MRSALLLALCLVAAGCVSTNVHRLDHSARLTRAPESVAVLLEAPEQPYTVIAFIDAKGESVFDSFDDIRQEMIAEAAELGGDAIILGPASTDTDFISTGFAMIRSDTKTLAGQVIVLGG